MDGQMTIFDLMRKINVQSFKPGDTVKDTGHVGRMIPWSELIGLWIGKPVWYRHIMDGWDYYELLIPEKALIKQIAFYENGEKKMSDRVICFDGTRQRALIDEWDIRINYKYPESNAFYEVV